MSFELIGVRKDLHLVCGQLEKGARLAVVKGFDVCSKDGCAGAFPMPAKTYAQAVLNA